MKREVYLNILFDYYGELLTDKERSYFESYYFDNLSLKEIADNYSVTRNAIHKRIKRVEEKLILFEQKLKNFDHEKRIIKIIKDQKLKEEIEKILES